MNRNTELRFGAIPTINQKRSKFDLSHSHKTTFSTGDLIPIYVDSDITPGDTVQMDISELIRMSTPIYPTMDNLWADVYFFFVPHRLVWEHWAEFWGENDDPWTQETEYEIPQIVSPQEAGYNFGTIADYMGIPTGVPKLSVNALPFRAYCKIWNDWFRDENLKECCHIYTDETTRNGVNTGDYVTNAELGAKPLKVAKLADYFTKALPEPQKGEAVQLPLGSWSPVYARWETGIPGKEIDVPEYYSTGFRPLQGGVDTTPAFKYVDGYNEPRYLTNNRAIYGTSGNENKSGRLAYGVTNINSNEIENSYKLSLSNLWTDLSMATASTIGELRQAFAIQKFYEAQARSGSRYIEVVKSLFGVTSSDARLQRAEYLGGQRIPINMDQVLQTSSTDNTSPQGNTAGFSCTINNESLFTHSFEEHGTLMGLICIRTEHTYQQGLNKMWSRKSKFDFYNPFFANLSEQGILNKEIYAEGEIEDSKDDEVFGYQEAWADYRYKTNRVSGMLRSNYAQSLDAWHYADDYETMPYLSTEWIDETYENVDRTLAVGSSLANQFIADFYFKTYYTRCMPVYSVPGLIDHV